MPPARLREPKVAAAVIEATNFIYSVPGATLQSAAQHVRVPLPKLRYLMGLPHNHRWMLQEKQSRLEIASASNIEALLTIRDRPGGEGNEMAKVAAAKTLETMFDNTSERTGLGRQTLEQRKPGLQIVVIQGPPPAMIEAAQAAPLIEVRPAPAVPVSSDAEDPA
jgi:hypothetical protein